MEQSEELSSIFFIKAGLFLNLRFWIRPDTFFSFRYTIFWNFFSIFSKCVEIWNRSWTLIKIGDTCRYLNFFIETREIYLYFRFLWGFYCCYFLSYDNLKFEIYETCAYVRKGLIAPNFKIYSHIVYGAMSCLDSIYVCKFNEYFPLLCLKTKPTFAPWSNRDHFTMCLFPCNRQIGWVIDVISLTMA